MVFGMLWDAIVRDTGGDLVFNCALKAVSLRVEEILREDELAMRKDINRDFKTKERRG